MTSSLELDYSHYKEPLTPVKDGFGYMGTLAFTKDGEKVQCHICGELTPMLGNHVKIHKLNAEGYRKMFQLSPRRALVSPKQSERLRQQYVRHYTAMNRNLIKGLDKAMHRKAIATRIRNGSAKRTLEMDNIRGTCRDQTIERIKEFTKEFGEVPTVRRYQERYAGLGGTAVVYRHFGSWSEAMRAAGLRAKKDPENMSLQNLLDLLRRFYDEYGRVPQSSDHDNPDTFLPAAITYRRRWKSLNNARRAAGIPILVQVKGGQPFVETWDYSLLEQKQAKQMGFVSVLTK